MTQALIIDWFTSFSVAMPKMTVESGPLKSTDRHKYIPSAVTQEAIWRKGFPTINSVSSMRQRING
ncbi:hypothetical protein [Sodalis glossinidius]|uniref:hypothetical protein n=1 Tax=Sodalis glossinidius TaxID=63612 RepID=UPI001FB05407|nr:hypothetical protein [Sodalis glossinidius]